ncbi:hypothetical protein K457DRAFT_127511 [Linnemannia elongata AG-77]|uniref:Uncharacterized protein n=1 Tax=Linnemannia elongata AG-77 TaxID=1314771 RepID=A0A197JQV9_9FUNG|nr:hypothetical protein K457DRAFT_127511 [Linnemannia elongata AG-77]
MDNAPGTAVFNRRPYCTQFSLLLPPVPERIWNNNNNNNNSNNSNNSVYFFFVYPLFVLNVLPCMMKTCSLSPPPLSHPYSKLRSGEDSWIREQPTGKIVGHYVKVYSSSEHRS